MIFRIRSKTGWQILRPCRSEDIFTRKSEVAYVFFESRLIKLLIPLCFSVHHLCHAFSLLDILRHDNRGELLVDTSNILNYHFGLSVDFVNAFFKFMPLLDPPHPVGVDLLAFLLVLLQLFKILELLHLLSEVVHISELFQTLLEFAYLRFHSKKVECSYFLGLLLMLNTADDFLEFVL